LTPGRFENHPEAPCCRSSGTRRVKFIDGLSGHLTDVREPHKALRHGLRDTREFFRATHGCIATLRAGRPEADLLF